MTARTEATMAVDSRKLFSMTAQIGRGVRKSESHLVTDAESSKAWDEVAGDVARIKASGQGVEIPHDPEF